MQVEGGVIGIGERSVLTGIPSKIYITLFLSSHNRNTKTTSR